MKNIGIYIHVPFCRSKCPYCDFYSFKAQSDDMYRYCDAVKKSMKNFFASNADVRADTLYFGGGTPSLLGGERISSLVDTVSSVLTNDAEITVECNPSDDLNSFFSEVSSNGVNRISLGMQSAVTHERHKLGRRASSDEVMKAIEAARRNSIDNISLDLMLGTPDMTLESLDKSLEFIKQADVPHVSAYMLKIEDGTPFSRMADRLNLPNEDTVCDMYLKTCDYFNSIGLNQYEISNFARSGFESRHNLKYWNCEEYIGFGPSAHSFFDGKRFYYPRDFELFLDGASPVQDGDGGSIEEKLMLGLRLTSGIDISLLSEKSKTKLPMLEKNLLIVRKGERIAMTPKGFLISNAVISELIE